MTRWLEAARKGQWRTDKLTELTEPNLSGLEIGGSQPQLGFCQYRQSVSSTQGRVYGSAAIAAGAAAAFEDFDAANDPHDPRAWA